jgi:hypothetical protein
LVSIEPVGSACLRVDRTGGPAPDFDAAMLLHAIAGLRNDQMHADSAPDGTIAMHCQGLAGSSPCARAQIQSIASSPRPVGPDSPSNWPLGGSAGAPRQTTPWSDLLELAVPEGQFPRHRLIRSTTRVGTLSLRCAAPVPRGTSSICFQAPRRLNTAR